MLLLWDSEVLLSFFLSKVKWLRIAFAEKNIMRKIVFGLPFALIYYVCITFEVFILCKMLLNNLNIVCKWNDNYDV